MTASQLVTRLYVDGAPLTPTNTRLVLDEGWAPYAAATLTVPYTPERAAALDPRDHVRIGVEVSRYWSGSITLDDLSDRWYVPPIPPGPPAAVLYTNLFTNPDAVAVTGTTPTSFGGTGALMAVTRIMPPAAPAGSRAAARFTRTGAGSARITANISLLPSTQYTVRMTVRTSFDFPAPALVYRPALASATGQVVVLNPGPFTPGVARDLVATFTTTATAPTTPGFMFSTSIGVVADTFDITKVTVVQAPTSPAAFSGATPDTSTRDYAWTGAADASTSTESTVYDPGDPGTTLDDLSAAWAGLTLDDLSAAWGIDWGNGVRPPETITADLILRECTIDHAAATISLRAGSDELLAQDARAYVERPVEPLPERLVHLLDAGHIPIGPPPDFSAGDPFVAMPAQTTEYSQTIWESMQANAASCGLRLWCDEARVWHLGFPDAAPAVTVDLPYVSDAGDQVNRDGDYADVLVWIGKGINDEALPVTETKTWPPILPAGPYRATAVEHDYGQVGASIPMPSDEELAARLALLQSRDRVLSLTAVADPTLRPGMGVTTGPPSLPATASTVARVEWAVPADTMTLTTRSTTEA